MSKKRQNIIPLSFLLTFLFTASCDILPEKKEKSESTVIGVWEIDSHETVSQVTSYPIVLTATCNETEYTVEKRLYIKITDTTLYEIERLSGDYPAEVRREIDADYGFENGLYVTRTAVYFTERDGVRMIVSEESGTFWTYELSGESVTLDNGEKYTARKSGISFGSEIDRQYDAVASRSVEIDGTPSSVIFDGTALSSVYFRADLKADVQYYIYSFYSLLSNGEYGDTGSKITLYSVNDMLLTLVSRELYVRSCRYSISLYVPKIDMTLYIGTESPSAYHTNITQYCGVSTHNPDFTNPVSIILNQYSKLTVPSLPVSGSGFREYSLTAELSENRKYWVYYAVTDGSGNCVFRDIRADDNADTTYIKTNEDLNLSADDDIVCFSFATARKGRYYIPLELDSDTTVQVAVYDTLPDESVTYTYGDPVTLDYKVRHILKFTTTGSASQITITATGCGFKGKLYKVSDSSMIETFHMAPSETKSITVQPDTEYYLICINITPGTTGSLSFTE